MLPHLPPSRSPAQDGCIGRFQEREPAKSQRDVRGETLAQRRRTQPAPKQRQPVLAGKGKRALLRFCCACGLEPLHCPSTSCAASLSLSFLHRCPGYSTSPSRKFTWFNNRQVCRSAACSFTADHQHRRAPPPARPHAFSGLPHAPLYNATPQTDRQTDRQTVAADPPPSLLPSRLRGLTRAFSRLQQMSSSHPARIPCYWCAPPPPILLDSH